MCKVVGEKSEKFKKICPRGPGPCLLGVFMQPIITNNDSTWKAGIVA
jgi:hypothetical protein